MMDFRKNNWLAGVIAVCVVGGVFLSAVRHMTVASARQGTEGGISGSIEVLSLQIGRDSYGIAMIDTVGHNLWIYEINSKGPAQNCLRLIAARSFEYDRLLRRYNTAEPYPETVKKLLFDLQAGDENVGRGDQNDIDKKEPNKSDL